MDHTVKHFSQYRVGETELYVVADVPLDVMPVVRVEKKVIGRYLEAGKWPHRRVTLFILHDLQPLVRQLHETAEIPLAATLELRNRPMVNVYDVADLAGCYVFINKQEMERDGYWSDAIAVEGMLAHEHAHPLAENETTRSSRCLRLELVLEGSAESRVSAPNSRATSNESGQSAVRARGQNAHRILSQMADKLCLHAPQEIFANETSILSGFAEPLFHLDRRTVADARRNVFQRGDLCRQLAEAVAGGNVSREEEGYLLLLGDLQAYLDLALEVVPFQRAGRESEAAELEAVLKTEVFPRLEPEVAPTYAALGEHYRELRSDLNPSQLTVWGNRLLNLLTKGLADRGLVTRCRLETTDGS